MRAETPAAIGAFVVSNGARREVDEPSLAYGRRGWFPYDEDMIGMRWGGLRFGGGEGSAEVPMPVGAYMVGDAKTEMDEGLIHFEQEANRWRAVQADTKELLSYADALRPLGQLPEQDVFRQPPFDVLPEQQRLEETQPVVAAYIGERPVFLSMPDVATSGGRRRTIPLTVPRMRRQRDIYYGRATEPFVRSELTGVGQDELPAWVVDAHNKYAECMADCDSWWERTFGDPEQCVSDCTETWAAMMGAGPEPGPGAEPPPDVVTPETLEKIRGDTEKTKWWLYGGAAVAVVGLGVLAFWPKR